MEKYFTPELEDLRVGLECEHTSDMSAFEIENNDDIIHDKLYPCDVANYLQWGYEEGSLRKFVRIPYLTKEQIETEGWEITSREQKPTPYQIDWINAKKGDYRLWINLAMINSMFLGIDKIGGAASIIYRGQCKDINAFRWIIKLLGI